MPKSQTKRFEQPYYNRETGDWDSNRPPLHVGKQFPYENDRRAGVTHPDVVEVIGITDRRHRVNAGLRPSYGEPNRVARRAHGTRPLGKPEPISSQARRPHRVAA